MSATILFTAPEGHSGPPEGDGGHPTPSTSAPPPDALAQPPPPRAGSAAPSTLVAVSLASTVTARPPPRPNATSGWKGVTLHK